MTPEGKLNDQSYLCPPQDASDEKKLAWVRRTLEEGEEFLKSQPVYKDIETAETILMGAEEVKVAPTLSDVQVNLQKRLINDIVANLSNTRPIQGFETQNKQYDDHADILNKLSVNWYHNNSIDRKLKKVLQYAACSTGYLCPMWKRNYGKYGMGDIQLGVLGAKNVMPTQMDDSMDLQSAYTVTLIYETPIHLAHNLWGVPEAIVADRTTPTWYRSVVDRVRKYASPLLNSAANKNSEKSPSFHTVDIFHIYIMDTSVNTSGKPVRMGQWEKDKPLTTWSYEVPYVGQDLPTGISDPVSEQPYTRKAKDEDCLLYPQRRLIIATRHGILYDGTSFWWHGKVPVVKLTLDEVPWQYLGIPLTSDGSKLGKAFNEIVRGVVDNINVSLDPPTQWKDGMVATADVKKLSLRARGQRIKVNPQMGKVFETIIDPQHYNLSPAIPLVLQRLQELQEYLLDTDNIKALSKARQAPAADTVEAFNNLAGAITTDRSRSVECAVEQLGSMIGALFFQFYTKARRLKELGANGLAKEDFDFHPENMIPATLPHNSNADIVERAKWHWSNFSFYIEHGSFHDITSQTQRMTLLQLKRSGAPVSWLTIMNACNVPNIGRLPEDPETGKEPVSEIDKWVAEQKMMAQLTAQIQQSLQAIQSGVPEGLAPLLQGLQGLMQGNGGNPGEGRKPTGQTPPHLKTSSDGSSTVAESR